MKFGVFYEHQLPRPWKEDSEQKLFNDALDQIELADKLGFDYMWEVEHHFLEEYSHSSAPEVFLGAVSQRTKNLRIGTGINLTNPYFNHPARVAERLATLDLISNGRLDWGTGEGSTLTELGGFNISLEEKTEMWREGTEQIANMMAMTPYPGYNGKYFSMPTRNIVPKPVQKPHPPMWLACSRRDSIIRAAKIGAGALVFGFVHPDQAREWVDVYYETIRSEECVPLGHTVNPNIACVTALSVHENEEEALARGIDAFRFFGYSFSYHGVFGEHKPGYTSVWEGFEQAREHLVENAGRGGMGTPEQVYAHCKGYADAGVDQVIFIQQAGKMKHEHICESMELFSRDIMPRFKEGAAAREAKKREELAPFVEAALSRKTYMPVMTEEEVPLLTGIGSRDPTKDYGGLLLGPGQGVQDKTRGGAIPFQPVDPRKRVASKA